jgi:hypothetical protein
MATYKTESGQTIWDLSILLYGNSSNAVKLMTDNPSLASISGLIPPQTSITYTPVLGFNVATYFSEINVKPNTGQGNPLQGSGFDSGFQINGFY